MKKQLIFIIIAIILFSHFSITSYAVSDVQTAAIQTLLDDACRISGVPGISVAVLDQEEILYVSSGYANRETGMPANEQTLYELASVSKAFTAMGILLLEEQGFLSMTDSVQEYLPWLSFSYEGQPVAMQSLSLNNFLHHTSGLTNGWHVQKIPQGNTPDMLYKTVQVLNGAELEFLPGTEYSYGTVNYDVLGLVIETVSEQSYEDFMKNQVFEPLGLYNTYVYEEDANATGQLAQGYRSSFFITAPYDAPDYSGNKPAGYIISCAKDMARWLTIQRGTAQDIPEQFLSVVQKSHQGDTSVPEVNGMYYAGGWMVNADSSILEHGGQNPNFATEVAILPNQDMAICLLSNGSNINKNVALKIKDILDGNLSQSYEISSNQLLDIVLTIITIFLCLSAIVLFLMGFHRRKMNISKDTSAKNLIIARAGILITAMICLIAFSSPLFFRYDWSTVLVWQTYSIPAALISVVLSAAGFTWFLSSPKS